MTKDIQDACDRATVLLTRYAALIADVAAGVPDAEVKLRNVCNFACGLYLKIDVEDVFAAIEEDTMDRADGPEGGDDA